MNWTKTPPTKPGAYWCRNKEGLDSFLCDYKSEDVDLIETLAIKGEWCGPLVPAEEADAQRVASLIADVMHLRSEVDCRIDHGARHGGHLDYVKLCLTQIIDAHR